MRQTHITLVQPQALAKLYNIGSVAQFQAVACGACGSFLTRAQTLIGQNNSETCNEIYCNNYLFITVLAFYFENATPVFNEVVHQTLILNFNFFLPASNNYHTNFFADAYT